MDGVYESSYWPSFTAQKNEKRNPTANIKLIRINKIKIFMK